MDIPRISLNDSTSIPQLGFGVFQVPPPQTQATVATALEVGYRHIDTAQMYGNEEGVGKAIAAAGIPRSDLYITTKLNNGFHRPDDAWRSFEESMDRLGLERLDLFLIHWPLPAMYDGDFVTTWETLIELRESGQVTSIGVSNFQPAHLQRIIDATGVVPAVNQVEIQPYFGNEAVRAANSRHGIATEAWSPIARGRVAEDPRIIEVAQQIGRTPSQVTLRWHVQRGDIVFPKSMHEDRMRENFAIFDFELDDSVMALMSGLDEGEPGRTGPNPDDFNWIPE